MSTDISIAPAGFQAWERYWFSRVTPHVYAALRILFGLLAVASLAGVSDVSIFWDVDGLVPAHDEGFATRLLAFPLTWGGGRFLLAASFAAYAAMTIGYRTRIAVPLSLAALVAQAYWNRLPLSAAHMVLESTLLALSWADCGAVWSLDALLVGRNSNYRGRISLDCPVAPLRLIRFQIALVYFGSGVWKLFNEHWRDGSAVHYVMSSNVYRRFPFDVPPGLDSVTSLLTYSVLGWELAFVPLMLIRRLRPYVLFGGIIMHLGMAAAIEVGAFPWVMLATYVSFVDPAFLPVIAAPTSARLRTGIKI